MATINNSFPKPPASVSPAWKSFGSQYKVGNSGGIVPKTNQSYVPASTLLAGKPVPTTKPAQTSGGYVAPSVNTPPPANNRNVQLDSIKNQALDIQNTLNQRQQQEKSVKGLVQPKIDTMSFGGLVGGLVDRSNTTEEQKRLQRKLEEEAQANKAIGENARQLSEMYGKEIAQVGKLGAGAVAGNMSTGSNVVGSGNANLAAQSASNRMNALATAQTAALQGTQQQLTGQEQLTSALTAGLGSLNTQQQAGISGFSQAGNLAQPNPTQYGQTVFDPLTGQYSGGNLDPQTQAANLAQQVMSGQMTYDQALASLGYAGQAGTNFLNNAITGAGGNALQLQAQGAGQQANISTQTTAGTDIARQGLGTATQDYVAMNTAAQFANQQASAVSGILEQTGLNNVSSTDYNKALNNLKGRFSDQNFASLNTALQEAQIAYTNLLSTGGGTPSGRESAALNTLNIDQSAAAINASIRELESAVSRRLQAQYGAVQQYNQNLGGGQTMGGGGGQWDW